MRLFRHRSFSGINAASLLMFLGMFGSIFLLSQYLQGVLGYSPTEAGLRMLPWTGMPMIVAPSPGSSPTASAAAGRRRRPRPERHRPRPRRR